MASVLVAGATGYVGGRLVPELLSAGHTVRCVVRDPNKLDDARWRHDVEVVRGDVTERASMDAALEGIDVTYYLVHSMGASGEFEELDRRAARTVADAAEAAGVGRIVYLGGLGRDDDPNLSRHLGSRHEVGRVLAGGATPVTELRAAVIIGSGSASFEMLRYLVEVLPMMVTPKWVESRCQPIAIRDVLAALVAAVDDTATGHHVVQIGGPDVLTYRQMMNAYAEVAGLRRRIIVPVPLLTPRLSSLWVSLVTPLPANAVPRRRAHGHRAVRHAAGRHPLVRCRPARHLTRGPDADRRRVVRRLGPGRRAGRADRGLASGGVPGRVGHRRRAGLVRGAAALGGEGLDRQARRWRGHAPRPPTPRRPLGR